MRDVSINFNGATILWSITGAASGVALNTRLAELELPAARVVDEAQALKMAMQVHSRGQGSLMIRPLSKGVGYALVQETDTGTDMEYSEIYRAIVIEGSLVGRQGRTVVCKVGKAGGNLDPMEVMNTLQPRFEAYNGCVTSEKMGSCLSSIVRHLGGVAVRPRGGVYWLSDSALPKFQEVAEVIEQLAPGSQVFRVRTCADEQTVRLVSSSLAHEVQTEASRIQEKLSEGSLGERAIESCQKRLKELRNKVESYEGILEQDLETLRDRLNTVYMAQVEAELSSPEEEAEENWLLSSPL